mmetsp:Transcript_94515/g.272200  ORF Transcript_94515/g.272200 Transcript_94515/m.272200 type:complete len:221 (-) Transcript_94515:475-1137(-)
MTTTATTTSRRKSQGPRKSGARRRRNASERPRPRPRPRRPWRLDGPRPDSLGPQPGPWLRRRPGQPKSNRWFGHGCRALRAGLLGAFGGGSRRASQLAGRCPQVARVPRDTAGAAVIGGAGSRGQLCRRQNMQRQAHGVGGEPPGATASRLASCTGGAGGPAGLVHRVGGAGRPRRIGQGGRCSRREHRRGLGLVGTLRREPSSSPRRHHRQAQRAGVVA